MAHDYADLLKYLAKYNIDEDIVQEALLRLSQAKNVRHARTWCYQKCLWLKKDQFRRTLHRNSIAGAFVSDPTEQKLADSPLRRLVLRDRIKRADAVLDEAIARKKQRAELREDMQVVLGDQ